MNIFLNNRKNTYSAKGTYEPSSKACIVKAGSIVSADITSSTTFHGRKTIEKLRSIYVIDGVVTEDVAFRSLSSAANFVTGQSTNGLIRWKTEEGLSLEKVLSI